MVIEDKELSKLFMAESEEHLLALEKGFLEFERLQNDAELLSTLLREAHSLKGAARMLGLSEIEALAHQIEDVLRAAGSDSDLLRSELVDHLLIGLDALRALCAEACGGEMASVDTRQLIDAMSFDPPSQPGPISGQGQGADTAPDTEAPVPATAPVSPVAERTATPEPTTPAQPRIEEAGTQTLELIRVESQRLDELVTLANELLVNRARLSRRAEEAESILTAVENSRAAAEDYRVERQQREQATAEALSGLERQLTQLQHDLNEDSASLDTVSEQIEEAINRIRMLSLSTLFDLFPRTVRDLSQAESKQVELCVEGGETPIDKKIVESMKDPLMHLVRNAICHGIESPEERQAKGKPEHGTVTLRGYKTSSRVVLEVIDDGAGLNADEIKAAAVEAGLRTEAALENLSETQAQALVFESGLTTQEVITDLSGRGVGLDVVRTQVEALKGTVEVESEPGKGTTFRCVLPLKLSSSRLVVVSVNECLFGIPIEYVSSLIEVEESSVYTIEGMNTVTLGGRPVTLSRATEMLGMPGLGNGENTLPVVVLENGSEQLAMIVDSILSEEEVVLKPLAQPFQHLKHIAGSAFLSSGAVVIALSPPDIIRGLSVTRQAAMDLPDEARARPVSILLAEDSLTTRTQEKRILEAAGYQVTACADGMDAWEKLNLKPHDAVVSDVMMPRMTGFELTERIRADEKLGHLPVLLVTTLANDEDRRRGLDAGANAYITKATFDQTVLIESLQRLVGQS